MTLRVFCYVATHLVRICLLREALSPLHPHHFRQTPHNNSSHSNVFHIYPSIFGLSVIPLVLFLKCVLNLFEVCPSAHSPMRGIPCHASLCSRVADPSHSADDRLCSDEHSHTGSPVNLWEVFSGTYARREV